MYSITVMVKKENLEHTKTCFISLIEHEQSRQILLIYIEILLQRNGCLTDVLCSDYKRYLLQVL